MKISPARIAAFEILLKIERDRAFSSVLLPEAEQHLLEKDKGLCHEIVLGVLRKKLYLDAVIAAFGKPRRLDPEVATTLRIGLYQILFLDRVPGYSAVNDSVNLVKHARKTSAKGFVNALLRHAEPVELSFADDIDRISVETSHPRWLIEKWANEFGVAEAEATAKANNIPSVNSFRITAKGKLRNLAIPDGAVPSTVIEGCLLMERIMPQIREMTENGEIYFQDEGSQLVAALADVPKGGKFLDVCAAPGSKTGMIGDVHSEQMITIFAGDVNRSRVEFLRANCLNQGLNGLNYVQYDAAVSLPFEEGSFDSILVDAPCSGTGTIKNNPEIRYFLNPSDFRELHYKQLAILTNASKLLTPGGRLVYSTCSLEREENEDVVNSFLARSEDFEIKQPISASRFVNAERFVRTSPARDGFDGFFAATIGRK